MSDPKILYIIGGLYGSGKSSKLSKHLKVDRKIDPDKISKNIPKKTMKLFSIVSAHREMDRQIENCFKNGETFSIEYTFVIRQALRTIKKAKKHGYHIYLFYVGTKDPKINIQRIRNRVQKGGHHIPKPIVKIGYPISLYRFARATKYADSITIMDNSESFTKVLEINNKKDKRVLFQSQSTPNWAKKLYFRIQRMNKPSPIKNKLFPTR